MAEVQSFSPIRMTAATEEAAVQQALQIVGADREGVSVEVVAKDAKGITVRVSPRREGEPESAAPAPVAVAPIVAAAAPAAHTDYAPDEAPATPARKSQSRTVRKPREAAAELTAEAEAEPVEARGEAPAEGYEEAGDEALAASASQPTFGVEPITHAPIDPALQQLAVDTAQDMLDRMGMDAECRVAPGGQENGDVPRLMLEIDGEDVGILIGKHGQTLQAFQYLLNITLNNGLNGAKTEENPRENSLRVVVDAGGYRSRRAGSLQQVAHDAAQRAVRDRRPIRMEPMPAHERRLVHMALQNDTSVTTGSDGREPMRFVVISPAGYRAPEGGEREGGRGYGGRSGSGGRGGFSGGRSGNRGGGGGNGGGGYRGGR